MLPGNLECHIMVKPMQIQQIENSCLIQSSDHTSLSIWRGLKIKWSWRTGSIPGSGLGIHGNILSYSMLSKAEPSVQLWNASGGDLNHYARSTSLPWGISGHWIRFGGFYSIPRCSIPSRDIPFHHTMFHSIPRCSIPSRDVLFHHAMFHVFNIWICCGLFPGHIALDFPADIIFEIPLLPLFSITFFARSF